MSATSQKQRAGHVDMPDAGGVSGAGSHALKRTEQTGASSGSASDRDVRAWAPEPHEVQRLHIYAAVAAKLSRCFEPSNMFAGLRRGQVRDAGEPGVPGDSGDSRRIRGSWIKSALLRQAGREEASTSSLVVARIAKRLI